MDTVVTSWQLQHQTVHNLYAYRGCDSQFLVLVESWSKIGHHILCMHTDCAQSEISVAQPSGRQHLCQPSQHHTGLTCCAKMASGPRILRVYAQSVCTQIVHSLSSRSPCLLAAGTCANQVSIKQVWHVVPRWQVVTEF